MTMVIDNQGRQYGGINFDHMYSNNMQPQPQFSDPWSHQIGNHQAYSNMQKQDTSRPQLSLPYTMPPVSAPIPSGSQFSNLGYNVSDGLNAGQDIPRSAYSEQPTYSQAPQQSTSAYAPSYPTITYAQQLAQQQQQQQHQQHRKMPETETRTAPPSFPELDASRGMIALSHANVADLTPRNIYEARQRSSMDSYGFPSANSSISAESGRGFPYYASSVGSVADSATDYSSAASDSGYDPMSRTLPRPSGLMGAPLGPPAPQSMMGSFSSKMSGNTQKKHKCKVCDKRFTRPSSLQTHMYSHTGEKPFACEVEGCGRHFSVVSNLRRHKKVHKGDSSSVTSEEHEE